MQTFGDWAIRQYLGKTMDLNTAMQIAQDFTPEQPRTFEVQVKSVSVLTDFSTNRRETEITTEDYSTQF